MCYCFFFSSRRRHTRCALVTGVQTCALPICVLVVDDDVRNIFALSSVLERHGMQVVTAGTGQEAIEKVAGDMDIDLVLMDIMMPGMDGLGRASCRERVCQYG